MPTTIEYANNPNEETAFVTPEGGQRTRTVLTASLEGDVKFPDNPNSTKVSVTVDGVARKAVAVYNLNGGSSDTHNKGYFATQAALEEAYPTAEPGDYAIVGATDTIWIWDEDTTAWVDTDTKGQVQSVNSKTGVVVLDANDVGAVPQYSIMPMAGASNVGTVQYIGTTDSTYTHNYFYENVATAVYDSTVSFEAATLSSSTIACSGSDFAAFVAEWGSGDITTITHGTLTYDQSGGLLVFVGKDTEETTVCTFQLYTEDYQDAGFTITGTLQDGDVFVFTTAITESFTYAWSRKDVQPTPDPLPAQAGNSGKFLTTDGTDASWAAVGGLPDQTGQSGKYLTTDGTDASWSDKVLASKMTDVTSLSAGSVTVYNISALYDRQRVVIIGQGATFESGNASEGDAVVIGYRANVRYSGALPIVTRSPWSVVIGSETRALSKAVVIGYKAQAGEDSSHGTSAVAIGYQTGASGFGDESVMIGYQAKCKSPCGVAIGYNASTGTGSAANASKIGIAIGYYAVSSVSGAIQIGRGTNSTEGTLQIGSTVGGTYGTTTQYRLLEADGTIPADRLPNAINKYSSMPTAASTNLGWIVQYTGTTDANYTHGYIYECVSDGGNPATYSWSAVSVQAGGGSSLPSQTGNSGKFLTTDGTNASWATVNGVQNTATGTDALTILGTATTEDYSINIGYGTSATQPRAVVVGNETTSGAFGGVTIGDHAQSTGDESVAIGDFSKSNNEYAVAVGSNAQTTGRLATSIGGYAQASAACAIQIGQGTNATSNTLSVGLSDINNYRLLNSDGTIPADRLASTTGLADGNYRLRLTMASGVPTLSWVAE